ncbi:MAG: hypothetical protein KJP08_07500 [Gammaproteobacteria bacterium]|nr:hypothetical protein [Gammaproteobacteria bacterium]NNF50580.1 hypothetical protein [Woeseiaceae bacterium]MBT8094637.1 hypothetical protein [Gammaproteobacteria bacterium]MBT8106401.1 hypothetical protein [Gammaproteobacteria bacterium]NNK26416.1 hypothetical protein [Woeseiaceae bacterium]
MLALFATLIDILRLRKGPDAIPYSPIVFGIVLVLWLFAQVVAMMPSPKFSDRDLVIALGTGFAVLAFYAGIVIVAGHRPRVVQTVSAVLGCGALLMLLFVVSNALLAPILSQNLAGLVATLILLWSILVDGHIVARAIERPWFVGFVAAVTAFVLQYVLYAMLNPQAATAT